MPCWLAFYFSRQVRQLLAGLGLLCAACRSQTDPYAAVVHAVQLGYDVPIHWWLVFLPQFLGHAGHFLLVLFVLSAAVSSHAGPQ
jgi:hypothetical protein